MNIQITADSICDLSPDLLEKFSIRIVPLYVILGEKAYKDLIEIQTPQLFEAVEKEGLKASTSAVSEHDYIEFFSSFTAQGKEVVHICISDEMSASYQNAVSAAKKIPNVYIVDSRNVSTGTGLLAIRATELVATGLPAVEVQQRLIAAVPLVETGFVIDTFDYLRRGGRVSSMTAFGGGILKIKPSLEVKDGKLGAAKKYRGKIENVLPEYVIDRLTNRDDIDLKRVFITHTFPDRSVPDQIAESVKSLMPFEEVYVTDAGCVISCHAGPKVLGILFMRKA
jgi:DegV family protein with EDD domain